MEIAVFADNYGSLYARPNNSCFPLFQFEWRDGRFSEKGWFFWPRGSRDPEIFRVKKKEFPMDYFVDLCRAKSFLKDKTSLTEDVIVVSGKRFVGLK